MFEEKAEEFKKQIQQEYLDLGKNGAYPPLWERIGELWEKGAEFGYNKAKDEIQKQNYGSFDFVMKYENGKFKCKYKFGKEFESVDGETWKEIVLPKEIISWKQ